MKINRFEDMLSWQKVRVLAIAIYTLFKNEKNFNGGFFYKNFQL